MPIQQRRVVTMAWTLNAFVCSAATAGLLLWIGRMIAARWPDIVRVTTWAGEAPPREYQLPLPFAA